MAGIGRNVALGKLETKAALEKMESTVELEVRRLESASVNSIAAAQNSVGKLELSIGTLRQEMTSLRDKIEGFDVEQNKRTNRLDRHEVQIEGVTKATEEVRREVTAVRDQVASFRESSQAAQAATAIKLNELTMKLEAVLSREKTAAPQ